jgi:Tol biopolymer transport system component
VEPKFLIGGHLKKITDAAGLEDEPAFSPDGKYIAYTTDDKGNLDIMIQPVDGGAPMRVVDSDADDAQPAWSPDGTTLAFISARDQGGRFVIMPGPSTFQTILKDRNADIFISPAFGGDAKKVVQNGYDPTWSPDGKYIAFRSAHRSATVIFVTTVYTGSDEKLRQLTFDVGSAYQPCWSPDGEWIVYGSLRPSRPYFALRAVSAKGGVPRTLLEEESYPLIRPWWSPDSKFIFFSSRRGGAVNLWRIRFFESEEGPASQPIQVTAGEGSHQNLCVAPNGQSIAFSTVSSFADIWELTLSSRKLRQVTFETGFEEYPHLSPDGKTLLFEREREGQRSAWTCDLNGKNLSKIVSDQIILPVAQWSPDGNRIVYNKQVNDGLSIVIRTMADGSEKEVMFTKLLQAWPAWSHDGSNLAYTTDDTAGYLSIYSIADEKKRIVTSHQYPSYSPTWSPDGKFIAVASRVIRVAQEGRKRDIFVVPLREETSRQITSGPDDYTHPAWSPVDQNLIACLRNHQDICLISVKTGAIEQVTNFIESNIALDYPSWSFDGKKLYFNMIKPVGDIYILQIPR